MNSSHIHQQQQDETAPNKAVRVQLNWKELRDAFAASISEFFGASFILSEFEKDCLFEAALIVAVFICNTESELSQRSDYHDRIRLRLKNELRDAVGCCIRIESYEPNYEVSSNVHDPVQSTANSTNDRGKSGTQPVQFVKAQVSFQDLADSSISFGDKARRSVDLVSRIKTKFDARDEKLLSFLACVESDLNNAMFRNSRTFVEEVEDCVSKHSLFLIGLMSVLISSSMIETGNDALEELPNSESVSNHHRDSDRDRAENNDEGIETVDQSNAGDEEPDEEEAEVEAIAEVEAEAEAEAEADAEAEAESEAEVQAQAQAEEGGEGDGEDIDDDENYPAFNSDEMETDYIAENTLMHDNDLNINAENSNQTRSSAESDIDDAFCAADIRNNSSEAYQIQIAQSGSQSPELINEYGIHDDEDYGGVDEVNDGSSSNDEIYIRNMAEEKNENLQNSWSDDNNSSPRDTNHADDGITVAASNDSFLPVKMNETDAIETQIPFMGKSRRGRKRTKPLKEKKPSRAISKFLNLLNPEVADQLLHDSQNGDDPLSKVNRNHFSLLNMSSLPPDTAGNDDHSQSSIDELLSLPVGSKRPRKEKNNRKISKKKVHPLRQGSAAAVESAPVSDEEERFEGDLRPPTFRTIRIKRNPTRVRNREAANFYESVRHSRRGVVTRDEVSTDSDSGVDDVSVSPQPPFSQYSSTARKEPPLCLELRMKSTLQKGVWCMPGRVVGLTIYGIGPPDISCNLLGVVVDDYCRPTVEEETRKFKLLVCFRGEVPVLLDSKVDEESFYRGSNDDMVCVDWNGRVRLLKRADGEDQIDDRRSSSISSNPFPHNLTNPARCRPFGFAFRQGTQFDDHCEPVAYVVRSLSDADCESSELSVKFYKWLTNETILQDSMDWQTIYASEDDGNAAEDTELRSKQMSIAVVKGIRVNLMDQVNAFYYHQNVTYVNSQMTRYKGILDKQKQIYKKQKAQIAQQKELINQFEVLVEKLDSIGSN